MHESLRLYDAALHFLRQEEKALDAEDDDRLAELFGQRAAVMAQAWEKRDGCDAASLLRKLEAVRTAQAELARKAAMQKETLRLALQNSRKQGNRLAGYGKLVSNKDTAFTMIKEG